MEEDKGKAIANEDSGNSSRARINSGHRMLLPARPSNTNLAWTGLGGGAMITGGMYLPPLARREFYNYGWNTSSGWVRVYGPAVTAPPFDVNNFGEGNGAHGGAMYLPTHHSNINNSVPQIYFPNAVGTLMINVPNTWEISSLVAPLDCITANNFGDNTSAQASARAGGSVLSETTDRDDMTTFVSSLNPNAPEWKEVPIEDRSLFVTFSLGYPLTTKQVFWYLAQAFGIRNLHTVDINKPRTGPAHFGRLVFNTIMVPMEILKGKEEARLMIYGRSMFCKRYRPKKDREKPPNIK